MLWQISCALVVWKMRARLLSASFSARGEERFCDTNKERKEA